MIEPPCTEPYARWCERSATQLMGSLLLDLPYFTFSAGDFFYGSISFKNTRKRIAKENGITETAVRRADEFARGVDIAEAISPGTKIKILSEEITPAKQDVRSIAKLPLEKRAEAVARLYYPRGSTHSETNEDRKRKESSDSVETVFEDKPCQKASEENILGSMQGSVDLFISTYNNYFIQFPILKTEKKYRKKTIDILETLKKYIEQLEGELK